MMEQQRIQKLMSQAGLCSRREAEELIKNKKVFVNGKLATLGQKATENDEIIVNKKILTFSKERKYYVLNKPKKTVSTSKDNFNRTTIFDYIDDKDHLFSVGRLDYDTTGVIIITNDGELAKRLSHPSYEVIRVYRARLNEKITREQLDFLNGDAVEVNGKISKQTVEQIDNKSYIVSLHVGSYHHVKKIFESVEREVIDLKRISFGGITSEKLMLGEYRKLKSKEISNLKKIVNIL